MATISHITLPDGTDYSIQATGIFYGEVDSTSTSTVFTATIPGITEYYDGLTILLKNGVVTSAANFTININDLGAKGSYSNQATGNSITPTNPTRDTTIFNINYTMMFTYCSTLVSGGCWICYRGYNSDTNTIAYQVRTNSTALKTTDRTRYYRILFSSADDTKWVPANTQYDNSATSTKTVNTRKINPFGRIVYLGNSTNYAADAVVAATALWHQYALALGYSFNRTGSALTLTSSKPVYVKCAPQTDGSAIMDSTTPIVQDLPSTEDGKIYIFLGMAYSATNIEMFYEHPVYYYKDGCIRIWTNAPTVSVPTASDANPQMDGTAAAGTSNDYSRADHVHPSDTSKVDKVSGKGLSTNDYTTAEKNKLAAFGAASNILRNGMPTNSIIANTTSGLSPAEAGWQFARNSANKVDFAAYAGQYFDINFITSDGMLQLTKAYQTQGVERYYADELIDLIPLSNITLSFEIKSEVAFSLLCKLHAMDNNNVDVMTCFNRELTYDSAVSDWTKVVINGTVPENYHEEFTNLSNKACRMLFQLSAGGVGHVYLRNFKLEYGDEATLFSLSDNDVSVMLTRAAMVPVTAGTYALTASIGEATTKPTFSWDAVPTGLPSVSASDNGKVLTVVNGAWAAAELPIYEGSVMDNANNRLW